MFFSGWTCGGGSAATIIVSILQPGSLFTHYNDVLMSGMASQITSLTIVYTKIYSGVDQRKHQSSASLAFVGGIQRWPHKGPLTRKMFPFDDAIVIWWKWNRLFISDCFLQRQNISKPTNHLRWLKSSPGVNSNSDTLWLLISKFFPEKHRHFNYNTSTFDHIMILHIEVMLNCSCWNNMFQRTNQSITA